MHAHARHAAPRRSAPHPPFRPPTPTTKTQICNEFERFSRYLPDIKTKVFYGGVPVAEHKRILKSECPHIIVGTPGRILQLVREKELLDQGHQALHPRRVRQDARAARHARDVQEIFKATHEKHEKQVMMFSATLAPPSPFPTARR